MKVSIYGQIIKSDAIEDIKRIFKHLDARGITYIIHRDFFKLLQENGIETPQVELFDGEISTKHQVKYLLVFGGDGTILRAAHFVYKLDIPIVGINTGRLGFLSTINKEAAESALDVLFSGKMNFSTKSMLQVDCGQNTPESNIALNEIAVSRKDTSAMVSIAAWINGEFLSTYWADGLIVSTATGSTGYSLSCGGPILTPEAKNIVLTPIAPHNLNVRPLVLPDDCKIKLQISGREDQYLLSVDSGFSAMSQSVELHIRKSSYTVRIGQLPGDKYFETLREKLHWGMDKRN